MKKIGFVFLCLVSVNVFAVTANNTATKAKTQLAAPANNILTATQSIYTLRLNSNPTKANKLNRF